MEPRRFSWSRGLDLNQGPSGYEPDELPGCSTPQEQGAMLYMPSLLSIIYVGKAVKNGGGPAADPPRDREEAGQ